MPTTLPRLQVTVTPQVGHALELAARRWPDRPRSALAARLIVEGSAGLVDVTRERRAARREAIRDYVGALSGAYPPGYLDDLRADWPA